MASGEGDYYWQEIFEQSAQRADVELAAFRQRVAEASTTQEWRVYVSPLVESQRQLNRLRADRLARSAKLIEIISKENKSGLVSSDLFNRRINDSFAVRTAARGLVEKRFTKEEQFKFEAILKAVTHEVTADVVSIDVKDIDSPTDLRQTADQGFELQDVPREELRRRLNRGEIAPRDEWMPTSKTKKKISPEEMAERLAFAAKLRQEGKEACIDKRYQDASTLYAQGVSLMEHVTSVNLSDAMTIQQYLSTFRRNKAIADTQLKRYRDAIASCDAALNEDDSDGKALYLRGRAYQLVGDLDTALQDFKSLATSPNASDESRRIGNYMWREVAKENSIHSGKMKTAYNIAQIDWFRESDAEKHLARHESPSAICPAKVNGLDTGEQHRQNSPFQPHLSFQPNLSIDEFIDLMRGLLREYTKPSVAAQIEKARHEAEYDEKKTILKFRKLLPPILEAIYRSHGLKGDSYADLKMQFDRHLTFYGPHCNMEADHREELNRLVAGCREALFGDVDAAN